MGIKTVVSDRFVSAMKCLGCGVHHPLQKNIGGFLFENSEITNGCPACGHKELVEVRGKWEATWESRGFWAAIFDPDNYWRLIKADFHERLHY
jgi:DNA-directed RNA polymerase subunit RPC12/RpoP